MAIKAVAEAGKTRTSSSNASKFNGAQPLLQAKASEASSSLSLLIAENSQQKAPAENSQPFNYHKSSPLSNIISSTGIQTQLSIGAPNDSFEREADRVADNVINISTRASTETSPAQSGSSGTNAAVQSKTSGDSPAAKSKENTTVQTKINLQKKPVSVENMLSRAPEEGEEEVQAKFFLQRGFMDLDGDPPSNGGSDLLAKFIQTNRSGKIQASATFESSLSSSKGAGSPLSSNTRSEMEPGIGADFSGVRIHTDNNAAQMSQDINARAFTHGNDIYFNQGQYNPDSSTGKHLIAHELTHTVQQGASVQTQSNISSTSSSTTQPKIQRGWLGDAWDSVSSAASSAVEWAADQLNQALNWAKDQFGDFVQGIPGYKLLSVMLGQDPIKGSPVARNGRNFIEAGLDIIPFGDKFQRKLEETGAMEEAATWLDAEMAKVDISLSSILNSISAFWDSLSITDLGDIPAVLNRASNIIRRPVSQIITFATNIASKLLEIVKKAVLSALVNFVKEHTRGYPLLTVILGKDPITNEVVERNGMNLIRGFMMLSEAGEEQLRQMQETGSLQKAADWIDITVARLDLSWETIQNMFSRAWDLVSITSLMDPIGAFQELANIFLEPAGRILRFLIEVGIKILQLIKDALISRLVAYARTVRGYPLITVILGRDPFSGDPVLRNTENIVHGFMSLMDGGEEQFQEMKSSGAIGRLTARVEAAMGLLNFTWVYIRGLFTSAWESFSLSDLAAPFEAFARLLGTFADPLLRLIAFVWEIIKIVIEVLLTMMQFPFALINNIITRAMEAIEDIKRDPIGFLKNLIRAVKQGFIQFFDRIGTHLLNGVTDWLFGQLDDAGISPPADLSFGSILGLVLEILGITVDRIWSKLADRIGQERVDRVRGMIDRLTGIWTFVKDVMQRGVVAIWEYIQERLSNLWDTVLSAIRNWIVTRIVQQVTAKLLSMLDPTGIMAVINGFIAFYNAVQSFIQYLREMLEIVNSFVVGVAEIARGDVSRAANFLEGALAQGVPIAIGFLANQVGLGGLGRRIGEMIENVRGMVDTALDWLIDKAVSAGSSLLNMGRNAVARVTNWWRSKKQFRTEDGKSHMLHFQGEGASAQLILQSDPIEIGRWVAGQSTTSLTPEKQTAQANVVRLVAEVDSIKKGTATSPRSMDAILSELTTNIQSLLGSNVLAEAKIYPDFSSGWFKPGDLINFIKTAEGVKQTAAESRVRSWKSTGDLRTWQARGKRDRYKKFSFVEADKDRDVPEASRRSIYGFGNNIEKDTANGWSVMEKTVDKSRSENNGISAGYKTATWASNNPGWINNALTDDSFRKTHAIFECARKKHGKGTKVPYFNWGPASMGHDDSVHEGAAGYWNAGGHKNARSDNMTWNKQVSNYWGPEHIETANWSGGFAPTFMGPTKESHRMWWDSKNPNWYGNTDSNYTWFLDE